MRKKIKSFVKLTKKEMKTVKGGDGGTLSTILKPINDLAKGVISNLR